MNYKKLMIAGAIGILLLAGQAHAITVHMSDFIADGTRTNFNGFESIPNDGTFYTGGAGPYVEGGISVHQAFGDAGNDIWVNWTGSGAHEGSYSWYPNGGDSGFTRITMADGSDFGEVGLLAGDGWSGTSYISYGVLNNGVSVLTGSFVGSSYLGFSAGAFDELRLVATSSSPLAGYIGDGTYQAFAVDSIEVRSSAGPVIPEPSTILLLGAGLVGLGLWGRKRMAK